MRYRNIDIHALDRVAVIWLNRPEVRNALSESMVEELSTACNELDGDKAVRAVVLAGRGAAFCAGLDLGWVKAMAAAGAQSQLRAARKITEMLYRLYAMSKPTVARVHGTSYAGALGLVCACDVAVASQDAAFCLSEVKVGLAAASILPYLLHAIGARQVRRYALSAETFSAAEAYRIGLVHELALPQELDTAVNNLLGQLVQGGPIAQASVKGFSASLVGMPITRTTPSRSAAQFASVFRSGEPREGIAALMEKRTASWLAPRRSARRSGRSKKAVS